MSPCSMPSPLPRPLLAVSFSSLLVLSALILYLWSVFPQPLMIISLSLLLTTTILAVTAFFYWKEWRALPLALMFFLMTLRQLLGFFMASGVLAKTAFFTALSEILILVVALLTLLTILYLWNIFSSRTKATETEGKLLQSEEELRIMIDSSYDWEVWRGVDGRCKYMSPSCERITGYSREEFMADPDLFLSILHPEDREWMKTHRQEDLKPGVEKKELEFRLIAKSGETRWIRHQCQPILDQHGRWLGHKASNRDITHLKEKDEKLRYNEKLLKEAQHIAGFGHWELNHQSNDLFWSDEIHHIFDVDPRQFKGAIETFMATVHPDDRAAVLKAHIDSLRTKKPYDIEHRLQFPDGNIKWVREICTTEYDTKGSPVRSLGIVHDITAKHDVEAALIQERAMFMSGPVIIFIWKNSVNWPVEYVSENVQDILGYSDQDFFKGLMSYASLIHPDDLQRVRQEVEANSSADSTHFSHEPFRLIARDGRIIWALNGTTLVRDNNGQISHYQGYLVDITRTVQMEEEVLAAKKRLEFIIDAAHLGTWDWNVETGTVVFNEHWAEILGYTLDELQPDISTWKSLVHPDESAKIMAALTDHLEGRTPVYMSEHRLQHKSGKWAWVLNAGKVFQWDPEGKPLRMLGINLDISRQKQEEQLVLESSQRQEQVKRISSLKTMAGAIAHRFNNSMMVVMANLDMLQRLLPAESTELKMASMASQGAKEAAKVGSSMLTYVSQGAPRLQPEDLADLARDVLVTLQGKFPPSVAYRFLQPSTPIVCRFDKIQVREVLKNVLTNAIESLAQSTGEIGITFGSASYCAADLPLLFRSDLPDQCTYAFCQITDNGCGIAPENIEHIFEPFFTTKFIGRGLSLALAAEMMRSHQGAILVQSDLGKGTTARVLLPEG